MKSLKNRGIQIIGLGSVALACAVSALTLREGISKSILEHIPEITEVVDATEIEIAG